MSNSIVNSFFYKYYSRHNPFKFVLKELKTIWWKTTAAKKLIRGIMYKSNK